MNKGYTTKYMKMLKLTHNWKKTYHQKWDTIFHWRLAKIKKIDEIHCGKGVGGKEREIPIHCLTVNLLEM